MLPGASHSQYSHLALICLFSRPRQKRPKKFIYLQPACLYNSRNDVLTCHLYLNITKEGLCFTCAFFWQHKHFDATTNNTDKKKKKCCIPLVLKYLKCLTNIKTTTCETAVGFALCATLLQQIL